MNWASYALLAAIAAAATAVLAKIGIQGVPSNLATAIRTVVIVLFAWSLVWFRGETHALRGLSPRTWMFLGLSGIATGLSWLAYFRALQLANASVVAPIDKLSLPMTVIMAWLVLGEPISWRLGLGVTLMVIGALVTLKP